MTYVEQTPFLTGDGGSRKVVLRDAYIALDGVDVSAVTHSVSVTRQRDAIDVTPYTTQFRVSVPGQDRSEFEFEMWSDSAGPLPVAVRGQVVSVAVAAYQDPSPASPENPLFAADCIVTRYVPLTGGAGDGAGVALALVASGVSIVTGMPTGLTTIPLTIPFTIP